MKTTRARSGALLAIALLLVPLAAQARDTEHILPVATARDGQLGQAKLLDVPFYMHGQEHPALAKLISEPTSNRTTRGAFRSDEESCQVAVLSALIALQERAQKDGGDASVDIVSVTREQLTESATDHRCVAGSTTVHVPVKGKIVKLR
jgi:hypothetical protein